MGAVTEELKPRIPLRKRHPVIVWLVCLLITGWLVTVATYTYRLMDRPRSRINLSLLFLQEQSDQEYALGYVIGRTYMYQYSVDTANRLTDDAPQRTQYPVEITATKREHREGLDYLQLRFAVLFV